MSETHNCPSCDAPLELQYRFSKVVVCQYCNQSSHISPEGLDPLAQGPGLVSTPSILFVGATGKLFGQPFKTLGRMRFAYEGGFWDEWFLLTDDESQIWLQEDDGTFVAFRMVEGDHDDLPDFADLSPGHKLNAGGREYFITEKTPAMIAGSEGELFFTVIPGADVDCIDMTSGGDMFAIEYLPDETTLAHGKTVATDQISIDPPPMYQ